MKQVIRYQKLQRDGGTVEKSLTFIGASAAQLEQRIAVFLEDNAALIAGGVAVCPPVEKTPERRASQKRPRRAPLPDSADTVRCPGCNRDVEPEGRVGRQGMAKRRR